MRVTTTARESHAAAALPAAPAGGGSIHSKPTACSLQNSDQARASIGSGLGLGLNPNPNPTPSPSPNPNPNQPYLVVLPALVAAPVSDRVSDGVRVRVRVRVKVRPS